jgi:hypothetical protein
MSNVIELKPDANDPRASINDPFGYCPYCAEAGDINARMLWRKVGRVDHICCDKHNIYGSPGENCASENWRQQTPEEREENAGKLATMLRIDEWHPPRTVPAIGEREIDERARRVLAHALGASICAIGPNFDEATGDIALSISEGAIKLDWNHARQIHSRAVELLAQLASRAREIYENGPECPF